MTDKLEILIAAVDKNNYAVIKQSFVSVADSRAQTSALKLS